MPQSLQRFPIPQNANPLPHFPAPVPVPLPRFSRPVHCAFRCLSEVMESPPSPTISPASLPDYHPAFPIPCHHATLQRRAATLPATGRQARQRGGKESICWPRRDGTTPRHPHSRIAIVTYKKKPLHTERNPVPPFSSTHTTRETAPCHFCSPHPLQYPCLSHTARETSLPTLGSYPLPAPPTSLVSLSLPTLRVYHTL